MTDVLLSPLAKQDIEAIWAYVAEENLNAADRLLHSLQAAFSRLAQFPQLGHRRPDLTAYPLRFLPVASCLIVYGEEARALLVVRVLSGYQDVVAALADDPTV